MELDERKLKILKAIISNYLETGEPVGSRTISKYTDLNLSSATIRNEMADLEELGYIMQPHTSAGRIPTDAGYRLYVDRMMVEKDVEMEEMKTKLLERVDKMETMLKQVAKVLAYNTNYATMVSAPQYQNSKLKFIQLTQVDEEQLLSDLMGVVKQALTNYDAMRAAEGKALENDLRSRGNTILELVSQVEAGNAQTVIDYRTRLENKLKEVLANTAIDESRILTEAAIFADKVAVDEETVRLRSHLDQMGEMLTGGGAVGRKLDFLLQEMNREANTIGSKCTDVRLARIVVDIKAELEKIREQTQNIE